MNFSIIILAAGKGVRMRSDMPKVLHPLADKPLLSYVLDTARALAPQTMHLVYGHGGEQLREAISEPGLHWVEQSQRLGTGHAVMQAMPEVPETNNVLVLYGDVPLVSIDTLQALIQVPSGNLGLLTAFPDDPGGYGRIVRDVHGKILRIVEEKDADPEEKRIREINTGIVFAPAVKLRQWLAALKNDNAQGEYYLTDVIDIAVREKISVHTFTPGDIHETQGINDRMQLAVLERYYQAEQAQSLMRAGVTLRDPARLDIRGTVQTGMDVMLDVNVILEGQVSLGNGVRIGPNTLLRNSRVADGVEILANCVIEDTDIGPGCRIGPFARIRPGTILAEQVRVGNFVEIKKSNIAQGSKINHLSYIGDTEMGRDVNIGAGTITCNYDGANKHKTIIEDGVFVGSNTQLVAPVTLGEGATIGAGSTISRDAPPDKLTVTRGKLQTLRWKRPVKK
ncbi:MAG: UDP-N-acetylglucosamine diphosphorylase/glucosamine-1-phosphate N-acetyltransferase [Gammaproteobacteria bacterium]|nr:UDP-N-acetylglucosamine diphosphorylase/glucosamine-1-phosphate N-acetyltransferase [Gammaproteobacteria bacterium]